MNLSGLKNFFITNLENYYSKSEINYFFYQLTDVYLDLKRVDIPLNLNRAIQTQTIDNFVKVIEELKNDKPIQYIIGKTEFYGLPFFVNEHVLIPRPETEEIVKWVIDEIRSKKNNKKNISVLDLGTGSGCIAVSLAKNLPKVDVWALDKSKKAINIAQKNAVLNQVSINFIEDDILTLNTLPIKFDLIISNPPYVREQEKKEIKNNVLNYEPHLALFVKNENALIFYDKILDISKTYLKKSGSLFFEINQYLSRETIELIKNKEFKNIVLRKDFLGNNRMIKCDLI